MEKLLTSLFLQVVFKDTKTTKALMGMIFNEPTAPKVVRKKVLSKPVVIKHPEIKKEIEVPNYTPISDKKREVMEAIQYLKSKSNKTKSDKDKIQMLEVILKSV
jgi:hypothetical protein